MVLHTRIGALPATFKPEVPKGEGQPEDWADKIAKAVEARRAGQKMREGKPLVLSKTKRVKL